jgi:hypothetical protein
MVSLHGDRVESEDAEAAQAGQFPISTVTTYAHEGGSTVGEARRLDRRPTPHAKQSRARLNELTRILRPR